MLRRRGGPVIVSSAGVELKLPIYRAGAGRYRDERPLSDQLLRAASSLPWSADGSPVLPLRWSPNAKLLVSAPFMRRDPAPAEGTIPLSAPRISLDTILHLHICP
jgi:hypothetical protein